MKLLQPDTVPARYRVVFSTRLGGVSEGAFRSLNLGMLTGDEPACVVANRRLLCEAAGTDAETATMARQEHGARVTEARPRGVVTPGTDFERCDGLWTDRPEQAMLLVTADCLPVALWSADRLAVLHVGWRGLLEGIVEAGVGTLGDGAGGAAVGPAIGPCCYEVGAEVAEPFRARFGNDVLDGRNLDLPLAAERALREAGCQAVERDPRCTACHPELFFSHRRDRGRTGRQGIVAFIH
jgi:polyphenol oxidase